MGPKLTQLYTRLSITETPYHPLVKLNQSIMFCLRAGLLPLGKVYLHIRDFPLFVSVKCLRLQISAFPLFSMPSGLYDTPNFPSSPSHLPSSLSFIYFSFWLFPLLVPALPPPDNPRLLFTCVLFLLPSPLLNYSFLSLWGISCFPFLLPLPSPPPMPISTMTGCQFTGEQITAGNSASDF